MKKTPKVDMPTDIDDWPSSISNSSDASWTLEQLMQWKIKTRKLEIGYLVPGKFLFSIFHRELC